MKFLNRKSVWQIAIRKTGNPVGLPDTKVPFRKVRNPYWGWAADPFLFEKDGKLYLFAELYSWLNKRGFLGYAVVGKHGHIGRWKTVIKEDYHLSYPFIFEHNGDIYLCPESYQANSIYLYKAVKFPNVWEKAEVLVDDVICCDTTLVRIGGRVYGVTCGGDNDQLLLFRLNGAKGGLEFSTSNPVVSDRSTARPAGKFIFTKNGEIFRVSQDCSKKYGGALNFIKVEFDWQNYSEEIVVKWTPRDVMIDRLKEKCDGVHTFNRLGDFEVIDFHFQVFSAFACVVSLFCRLGRISRFSRKTTKAVGDDV